VVDRAHLPGGAMAGGAVASKTMREAALYLTSFKRRDLYNVGMGLDADVAAKRLRTRTDDVVRMATTRALDNLQRHGVDVIQGHAALGPDRTVVVRSEDGAEQVLHAGAIIVATGSHPFHPPGVPFDDPDVLDSDAAALLDRPLQSLVVVGSGAVGTEFASIFTALGAEVVLAESRARILPFMDAEIANALMATFTDMGMRVMLNAGHASATRTPDGIRVDFANGESLTPEKVIFATGRVGNTEDLGLDEIGVVTDALGRIAVDAQFRTAAEGIYAAGDVIGPPALASVSMEQARMAARFALDLPLKRELDTLAPYGVYSIPEAAMVGMTEEAAAEAGIDYAVGRASFDANTKAAISGATEGLLKLVVAREDHRVLGVHVLGESATELVHIGKAVIDLGGTIEYLVHTTFNAPTLSEAYKYAAYDGLRNL
jgi:NAD(P) transhydrogenase